MKKRIALVLAFVLCLSLCSCGQESTPTQPEQVVSETQPEQTAETTAEGYYVKEEILEDGTVCTIYYSGGPNGVIVKSLTDGTDENGLTYHSEVLFDEDAKPITAVTTYSDGTKNEVYFHPNGFSSKVILYNADDSYHEMHYLEDGTLSYEKYVTADGKVEAAPITITDKDGSRWITTTSEDGTVFEEHFSADNIYLSQLVTSPDGVKVYKEFYENGDIKCRIEETTSYKIEEHFDEEGYHTYYRQNGSVGNLEIITDEHGKVIKVLLDGYEVSDITSWVQDLNFKSW